MEERTKARFRLSCTSWCWRRENGHWRAASMQVWEIWRRCGPWRHNVCCWSCFLWSNWRLISATTPARVRSDTKSLFPKRSNRSVPGGHSRETDIQMGDQSWTRGNAALRVRLGRILPNNEPNISYRRRINSKSQFESLDPQLWTLNTLQPPGMHRALTSAFLHLCFLDRYRYDGLYKVIEVRLHASCWLSTLTTIY